VTRGGVLLRFVAALAAAALAGAAAAQDYPSRAITLVVPFAVGSGIDPTARIIGDALSRALKQPVVLDHKPGANGAIAASAVARAAPDGYTIFMTTVSTHSANPNLLKSIPYDPVRDFAALSRVGNLPFMLVIDPQIRARSVPEFIAYVKANPGKFSYASTNAIGLVAGATLKRTADLDLVHVPYRSSPQAINDVMTGRLAMMFVDFALGSPQAKAGHVRALAVTTKERSALLPDIPSMTESGLPSFDLIPWNAIFAPANTPKPIVLRLNAELRRILADPTVKERLAGIGFDAFASTPEELETFVREDLANWTRWVQEAGIEPE
jgi:tripartite-type tricarboxylate transporter receptor subunit TctC